MMTRREKLLTRPWQLRRYNNHKKKVINAVPVIDFGPPAQRTHVTVKLKKLQKEKERQAKIEEDNFKLLRNLCTIMSKKRVDNYWQTKPPTFLRRVGIYHRTRTPTPFLETSSSEPENAPTRRSKCFACSPYSQPIDLRPEGRVPWEPPKKMIIRRQINSAVCPVISDFEFSPVNKTKFKQNNLKNENPLQSSSGKKNIFNKSLELELPIINQNKVSSRMKNADQKIVLHQGSLQVIVNLPPYADVKVVRENCEKT